MVSTVDKQRSIHEKAKQLNYEAVLLRIGGHGDQCLDLIANDFRYHLRCVNKFMKKRPKGVEDLSVAESDFHSEHNKVFQMLVSEISPGLLLEMHAYRINQLKDRYGMLLLEQGVVTKKHTEQTVLRSDCWTTLVMTSRLLH